MPIAPERIRYIKLGEGGRWEKESIEKNIIRFGFGSARSDRFSICENKDWAALEKSFLDEGKAKGTAKRFRNETQAFFEADARTLWITFVGETLYWGFLTSDKAKRSPDGDGVYRSVRGGWKSTDGKNRPLTKDRLTGALTQLVAYRGTSCSVRARKGGIDVADYIVRRINGESRSSVDHALIAQVELRTKILTLIRELGWRDFEILVDLIFSSSGWRRLGVIGGSQATLDLDLVLPITGERAFVQVKATSTPVEFSRYLAKLDDLGPYDRMFYVFHTGNIDTEDDRVTLIAPERLAELVVDAGLTSWVINKVS